MSDQERQGAQGEAADPAAAPFPASAETSDSAPGAEALNALPDPAAGAELSEDEATGRRVESLLVETPDADPLAPLPARGQVIRPAAFAVDDDVPPAPVGSFAYRQGLNRAASGRTGPIVAFDFDGTLTVRDSFTAFLKWREGSARYHTEMAALAPSALKYFFDRDPGKLKAAAVRRFLHGVPRDVLNADAAEFAALSAPILFRPDALKTWRRFRREGARLIIVTASPENVVAPFARGLGCDLLIGTKLVFDDQDRVEGGLLGDNCRGPEKVRRIREALGETVVIAAAYGDTDGDKDMLAMAEQPFMKVFTATPTATG